MRAVSLALVLLATVTAVAVAEGPPGDATTRNNRAAELMKQGKLDEAVALFRQAVEMAPSDVVAQANLAYALEKQGRVDEAITAYRAVLQLDGKNAVARNNLAALYGRVGRHDDAARELQEVVRQDPANATAKANLANATRNQAIVQERQGRIADLVARADARPDDARAAYDVARGYAQLSDADHALAWLTKSLSLGFDRPDFVGVDPAFVTLRADPRFARMLEQHRREARPAK